MIMSGHKISQITILFNNVILAEQQGLIEIKTALLHAFIQDVYFCVRIIILRVIYVWVFFVGNISKSSVRANVIILQFKACSFTL